MIKAVYKKKWNLKKFKVLKRTAVEAIITFLLLLPGIFICISIFLLVTGSVMGNNELRECLSPIFSKGTEFVTWKLIPDYPTFSNYGKLLFLTPQFFVLFWNSMKMVILILFGQLMVGVPAAWAFAVYRVRGSKVLFTFYIMLMLLPFQVTMLSSYLVLNQMALLNTQMAVILPAVFSTLPIFLTYGAFKGIPIQLLEAARIDGAKEGYLFLKIGMPLGKGGMLSALVLGFLEYWNMMEQPMAFLEDKSLWPLSLYLPEITEVQVGYAFCASLITLIPAVFVFIIGQDYLEQGIIYSGMKV